MIQSLQRVSASQGPPPSLLLHLSSSSFFIPPPNISPVRCARLRVLRAAERGHGGLSQRNEDHLGAGD